MLLENLASGSERNSYYSLALHILAGDNKQGEGGDIKHTMSSFLTLLALPQALMTKASL